MSNDGFDEVIWKFDTLSCYQVYRNEQAAIVLNNKKLFIEKPKLLIDSILGGPYTIIAEGNGLTYQYLLESFGDCNRKLSETEKQFIKEHGLDVRRLLVVINKDNNVVIDIRAAM